MVGSREPGHRDLLERTYSRIGDALAAQAGGPELARLWAGRRAKDAPGLDEFPVLLSHASCLAEGGSPDRAERIALAAGCLAGAAVLMDALQDGHASWMGLDGPGSISLAASLLLLGPLTLWGPNGGASRTRRAQEALGLGGLAGCRGQELGLRGRRRRGEPVLAELKSGEPIGGAAAAGAYYAGAAAERAEVYWRLGRAIGSLGQAARQLGRFMNGLGAVSTDRAGPSRTSDTDGYADLAIAARRWEREARTLLEGGLPGPFVEWTAPLLEMVAQPWRDVWELTQSRAGK